MANTKIPSELIADNSVGIDALNVTDGTNGQYLQTDGAGTLSFSTVSGYTDSDVATYLGGGNTINIDTQGTIKLDGNYPVGTGNVALGDAALDDGSLSGGGNTAIGSAALTLNTSGASNTAVGNRSLTANTTGVNNSAFGQDSLTSNSGGNSNVAVGINAMLSNTTGSQNVGIGQQTLNANTTASNNTAVGFQALLSNTTGYSNVAVGAYALDANTTGVNNTAVGDISLSGCTTGYENTTVGKWAGASITTGYHNVVLGHRSAFEGNNITTGINNTLVGCFARTSSAGVDGELVLGRYALGQGGSTGSLGISGTGVHIAFNGSTTSWSAHSDERLKENIQDSTAGLSFINDLRPITYNWKSKKDISADFVNYYDAASDEPVQGQVKQTNHGFIAQEIKAAIDAHSEIKEGHSIWRESPDGVQNVADGALMPMMVKAVQELSAKCDSLQNEINILKGE